MFSPKTHTAPHPTGSTSGTRPPFLSISERPAMLKALRPKPPFPQRRGGKRAQCAKCGVRAGSRLAARHWPPCGWRRLCCRARTGEWRTSCWSSALSDPCPATKGGNARAPRLHHGRWFVARRAGAQPAPAGAARAGRQALAAWPCA